MTEIDLGLIHVLSAMARLVKDPDAWSKRADEIERKWRESHDNIAEVRKLNAETKDLKATADAMMESASYERGQADHAKRESAQQAAANADRDKELKAREDAVEKREYELAQAAGRLDDEHKARLDALAEREHMAEKVLADAKALMANYDEAKHKAALKLAG